MASIFNIFKVFRPRKTILSDDFNSFQNALKAAFDKLGTEPPAGKNGVSSAFWVGDPTEGNHAVHLDYLTAQFPGLAASEIEKARQWAEQAVGVDVNGTPGARSALHYSNDALTYAIQAALYRDAASAIRFEDANYLTFFYGQS